MNNILDGDLKSILFNDNELKQLLQKYSLLQLINKIINRDDSSFIIKLLIKNVILNDDIAEVIANNNIQDAKYIFDYFELDNSDQNNKNTIRELLFQEPQKITCLKIFGLPALLSVLNMTNKQDDLYKEVEQKIINDNSFIDKVLNNMDSNYLISLIINFHIKNKVDYLLFDKIVNWFMLNDDKIKSITNKYKFFQVIHKLSLISKDTHFVQLLKRRFILNDSYANSINNKFDTQYIFDLIDLEDNYDLDKNIIEELLFLNDDKETCLKKFGLLSILSVLKMSNKKNDLYMIVEQKIIYDNSFIEKILNKLDIDDLILQLKDFEINDKLHFILISKILNNNIIKDGLKLEENDEKKKLYSFLRMIIKKIGINIDGAYVIESLENALEQIDSKEYIKKDIVDSIWSPDGIKQIYQFFRGSFVIAPNGNQIKVNLDTSSYELSINGTTKSCFCNWGDHATAIGESLIMFGLPKEKVDLINDHPFPVSVYGKDNGYLIIQIEGEKVIIYCPNTISFDQFKTFEAVLSDFKKYEQKNGGSILFGLVLKNNKIIDEMLLHNDIYLEEIIYILLNEKLIAKEIINSTSSIKK